MDRASKPPIHILKSNSLLQEDMAIEKLVQEFGIKKWTVISQKMEEIYHLTGRSGKQCRERCVLHSNAAYTFRN